MFTIYNCIVYEHDLRLVVLAAIVCALASFAAINFLNHVRKTTGYLRDIWLCVAATASGEQGARAEGAAQPEHMTSRQLHLFLVFPQLAKICLALPILCGSCAARPPPRDLDPT